MDGQPEQVDFRGDGPPKGEGLVTAESIRETYAAMTLRFSQAASLAALAEEFVYFTHGLLFTHGFFTADPIATHVYETGAKCLPLTVESPLPFFKWFEARDRHGNLDQRWNRSVLACSKETWPDLFRFLCQVEGHDRNRKVCVRVIPQKIPVLDTIAMAKLATLPETLPVVDCICFALTTNQKTVYFAPHQRVDPWNPIPVLVRNPDPAVVRYAKNVFSDKPNPRDGTLDLSRADAQAALAKIGVDAKSIASAMQPRQIPLTDDELLRRAGVKKSDFHRG